MSTVRLIVGTKKAAFVYTSDGAREDWELSEPMMPGWPVSHMTVDSRGDTPRLYAATNHPVWGPSVAKSSDGGATWEQRSEGLGFPKDSGLTITSIWNVVPGHESEPGVVYAGTAPGGLFKSEDWGKRGRPTTRSTGTTTVRSGSPSRAVRQRLRPSARSWR